MTIDNLDTLTEEERREIARRSKRITETSAHLRRKELALDLRRIAQNDYMIDTNFLPDGEILNEAAGWLDPVPEAYDHRG